MEIAKSYDTVLVLDFGSQYSHLITRRVRELGVYCELLPCTATLDTLHFTPKGIILSGGPNSVYDQGAPHVDPKLWSLDVPILGICYGLQEMAWHLGGQVSPSSCREYGHAELVLYHGEGSPFQLWNGLPTSTGVWMSHGDHVTVLPPSFVTIACTETAPIAAIAHASKPIYGLQFHPEVTHTSQGMKLIENFVSGICKCNQNWTMDSFIDKEIKRIRDLVPEHAHVVGAVSGGVDSTVAAKLMTMAIGNRFHALLVDNGLMRQNEVSQVTEMLSNHLSVPLTVINASDEFLQKLKGITDPEAKRKIIGNTFIEIFEKHALALGPQVQYLLQGTLYPDVIESISFKGPSATIKSHHNVGGLLSNMKLKLIEPLRELFKDEVRRLGKILDVPDELLWRHPFPGPGLAIRILGEITEKQLIISRQADAIFIDEIKNAGLYREISQAFTVLLPIQSVGVMGDDRTYEQVICCRAVQTSDFMTADWCHLPVGLLKKVSSRIINEVKGVNRVVYDISSKPPSTIEWE